jgi:FkbM family methyltransferase
MSMIAKAKERGIRVLESHPYGYAAGVFLLDHLDFLLPHESDYFGFEELHRRGYARSRSILDVGANRGHSARAFLKLLPAWRVFSVEANRIHEPRLEALKHRHGRRFDYVIAAAGSSSGGSLRLLTPMYRGAALHSAASCFEQEAVGAVEAAYPALKGRFTLVESQVPGLALDDLALDPDFVKFDIQGSELDALKGMPKLLRRSRPVLLLAQNSLAPQIKQLLGDQGYEPWCFDVDTRCFTRGEWAGNYGHHNVFFGMRDEEHFFAAPTHQ